MNGLEMAHYKTNTFFLTKAYFIRYFSVKYLSLLKVTLIFFIRWSRKEFINEIITNDFKAAKTINRRDSLCTVLILLKALKKNP